MLSMGEIRTAEANAMYNAAAKLHMSGVGHSNRAYALLEAAGGAEAYLPNEQYRSFVRDASMAAQELTAAQQLFAAEREARAHARVTRDNERVYKPDGAHSYFRDLCVSAVPDHPRAEEARERLAQHRREIEIEIADRTPEGRHMLAVVREMTRQPDADAHRRAFEARSGVTSALSSVGAFTTPFFMVSAWAPFLERKPFARECSQCSLPEYGMSVSLPAFVTDAAASLQTEGTQISETDPTSSTSGALGAGPTASVQTIAGTLTVSQQLLDRSGDSMPSGARFDAYIYRQLSLDCDRQLDMLALSAALAGAGQVAYSDTSFTLASAGGTGHFTAALSQAKANIEGTPGAYLEPSHIFMVPQRWEMIAGWADSQGRPIILPAAADSDDGGGKPGRHYGDTTMTWGGLRVTIDPNIPVPATGSDQVIVADAAEIIVFAGPRMAQAFVEPGAPTLDVTLRLYGYAACLVRYASAVQTISGSGMTPVTL